MIKKARFYKHHPIKIRLNVTYFSAIAEDRMGRTWIEHRDTKHLRLYKSIHNPWKRRRASRRIGRRRAG